MRLIFIDKSTKLETINDLQIKARGGMISSLFLITDGLSRLGHKVTVLSDIKQNGVTQAGVSWVLDYAGGFFDILICNRGIGAGYPEINARTRILWTHDLPHNGFIPNPKTIKAFAATVFMSRYAEQVWRTFYPQIKRSFRIPNGVDRQLFYPREKDMDYLIFCSNPNRGFERLPLIYDAVKMRLNGNIRMRAYSNSKILHPNETDDPSYSLDYKRCQEVGIEVLDPIPQVKLADELGKAAAMVLPTRYPEICSNAVLQSLASGTPIFTTGNIGATPEWVRHGKNGMLTKYQPHDYMVYQLEMVRNLVNILSNPRIHRKMIRKAAQTNGILTWKQVIKSWNKMLNRFS